MLVKRSKFIKMMTKIVKILVIKVTILVFKVENGQILIFFLVFR